MQIQQNNYLTWQSANIDCEVSNPISMSDMKASWWKKLPGNLSNIAEQGCPHREILQEHGMRSAKFCLGLRGVHKVGYTIPLDQEIVSMYQKKHNGQFSSWQQFYQNVRDSSWPDCDNEEDFCLLPTHIQQECIEVFDYVPVSQREKNTSTIHGPTKIRTLFLHPAMLGDSLWAEKDANGDYIYNMILISWPWRARLPKGWRLYISSNPFDWSSNYHVFTGCVDANYSVSGNNINNLWNFDYSIDDEYNYFNVELVAAVKVGQSIPKDQCILQMIPVYDPDYKPSEKYRLPRFD